MSDRIIRIRAHLASLTAGGSDVEQEHTWRGRCAFLLRERDAAIARAEAAEALAASRPEITPETADALMSVVDDAECEYALVKSSSSKTIGAVTNALSALRAHAAKVSR